MSDTTGYRANIGVIVPSSNTTVQPECDDLRPYGITNHIGRVTVKTGSIADPAAYRAHVELMREGIGGAVDQLMTAPIDHLILGVAIETFQGGYEGAARFREQLEAQAKVRVTFGSEALVAGLRKFGARRIAVLTPHQPQGDAVVQTYFEQAGFDVVRLHGLKCAKPRDIACVPRAALAASLLQLDGDDIDAIVQVGTALAMAPVAVAAEQMLDKPVLAINPASYWHALRTLGHEDRSDRAGRLLREF
jgi:maleate isomerase